MVYLRWLLSMPLSYLMLLVGLILAPVLRGQGNAPSAEMARLVRH